jgi:hypothetical protein
MGLIVRCQALSYLQLPGRDSRAYKSGLGSKAADTERMVAYLGGHLDHRVSAGMGSIQRAVTHRSNSRQTAQF